MKKKPEPPVIEGSPEEKLERMKALVREIVTVPKPKTTKAKTGRVKAKRRPH